MDSSCMPPKMVTQKSEKMSKECLDHEQISNYDFYIRILFVAKRALAYSSGQQNSS